MYSPPQPCTSWCTELSGDPEVTVTLDQFRLDLKPTKSTTGSSVRVLNQGCFVFWEKPIQSVGRTGERVWARAEGGQTGGGWKERSRDAFLSSHGKNFWMKEQKSKFVSFCIHIFFSFWVWERRNYSCLQLLLSLLFLSFSLCAKLKNTKEWMGDVHGKRRHLLQVFQSFQLCSIK